MDWQDSIRSAGFAIIPGVLERCDIAELLRQFSDITLERSKAGIRHAMKLPAVSSIANDPRVLPIARAILGDEAIPFRATLFDKSSTANWLVVWHQDTALPLMQRCAMAGWGPWSVKDHVVYAHAPAIALSRVLALRFHLDDSDAENGPLRVLPGTHNFGVLTDEQLHNLSTKISGVDCLTPAGGILAMRPLLVHASSKSHSPRSRRVLHIEYATALRIADSMELRIA